MKLFRLLLISILFTASFNYAQNHKLGFSTEMNLYTETSNPRQTNLPFGIKMLYNIKFSEYMNFDVRVGAGAENLDYFGGWQFGGYYKPFLLEKLYGVIGLNLFRNSAQGVPDYGTVHESDKWHLLGNLGLGMNLSGVTFLEILYQKHIGNNVVSYEQIGIKVNDYKFYPIYYRYSIKLVLGFAWDL